MHAYNMYYSHRQYSDVYVLDTPKLEDITREATSHLVLEDYQEEEYDSGYHGSLTMNELIHACMYCNNHHACMVLLVCI